jgi:hypothetical protein
MAEDKLINVILSSNPCPKCVEASHSEPMTLEGWRKSEWGLPGSSGRYCKSYCHCILVPVGMLEELPNIKKLVEKADETISLKAIVDIHPNEEVLKELMDEWNETRGKLPPEIYDMDIEDVIAYLKKLMGKE